MFWKTVFICVCVAQWGCNWNQMTFSCCRLSHACDAFDAFCICFGTQRLEMINANIYMAYV